MRSEESRAAEIVESCDRFAKLRNQLNDLAGAASEYAGIPMPLNGESLVVEPSYPFAELLNKPAERDVDSLPEGTKVRNVFWSKRRKVMFGITEDKDGKITWAWMPGSGNQVDLLIRTLGCSDAWGVSQEANALQLLAEMMPYHMFKRYLLTGTFIETSKRSGITYVFRKLRPTVAIRFSEEGAHVLCALCMHTIGHYRDSWAGAMCPTDDVIAHLVLMRSDEHRYWKVSNQIPAGWPNAGI